MDQGEPFGSAAWLPVTCKDCQRAYVCTLSEDYYQPEGQAEPAGTTNGVCFGCMLRRAGLDPDRTPVSVVDQDMNEIDPRDEAP